MTPTAAEFLGRGSLSIPWFNARLEGVQNHAYPTRWRAFDAEKCSRLYKELTAQWLPFWVEHIP
jgi:hypothetical protein